MGLRTSLQATGQSFGKAVAPLSSGHPAQRGHQKANPVQPPPWIPNRPSSSATVDSQSPKFITWAVPTTVLPDMRRPERPRALQSPHRLPGQNGCVGKMAAYQAIATQR